MLVKRESSLQMDEKDKFQEQISLFEYFDGYRSQWDLKAVEWYKLLVGYKEELDKDDSRSNLHIPRTYQIVDTIRARMVMALFKNYPYIEYVPQPTQMKRFPLQVAEEKAQIASALTNEQLRKNNIVAKYYDYVTSLLTFPAGIMGVGWRYEEDILKKRVPVPEILRGPYGPYYTGNFVHEIRESREAIWDDNEIVNIDYFDFWPDPKGHDLDSCRGVFQREFVTYESLKNRLQLLAQLGEGIIYLQDKEELKALQGQALERGREERLSAVGLTGESGLDVFSSLGKDEINKNSEFELLHYWEDNRHCITVNRQKVVYDGPSPYWRHRKKPFIAASYDRLPNEFYGLSAVQIISDLQHEENTIHNQRTDNVNFILNKMWKVRRGADIDESELVSRPHGVVHVDRLEDVDEFRMTDVAASSFNTQNIISTVMENALATPPVMQGAPSRGDQTATETLKQTNNAGMRFDVKLTLFKDMGLHRLLMLMDMNNQQFIDGERLVRLGINESVQWRSINPGDLQGEFDYKPASASLDPAANKQARREQLTHMMQFLLQTGVPFVNYHKLIEEWLKSFDLENAEKFILPREQWQQQEMMMQMMQQQSMNQGQSNRPTESQQIENSRIGRARGRRPQTERNPDERSSGVVR
ncbi:MAG: hypothetical protein ACLFPF_07155 [Halanaerobiales bacterium]